MHQLLSRIIRASLVLLFVTAVSACKVHVIVPEGGRVVSSSGMTCQALETCVVSVENTQFDQTFTAEPAPGYRFSHWRMDNRFFCGDSNKPCRLTTSGFIGNETLMSFLSRADEIFYLQAVFEPSSRYDLSYWRQVVADIDSGRYRNSDFLYTRKPDVGNCDPGELSPAAKQRALEATNAVRALMSLKPVSLLDSADSATQQAALIQRANNFLHHQPPTSSRCYTAAGSAAAGSANLGLSSRMTDPAEDVFGWANDNHNVSTLAAAGHRRWLIFPSLSLTSYGQVDGASAQKVFNFSHPNATNNTSDREFVAFPYREFPFVLISKSSKPTPWSLSIVPASGNTAHQYFNNVKVTVVDDNTGHTLNVHSLYHDTRGYGLRNFLSWMVDDWEFDVSYTVTISNIIRPDGTTHRITYPVKIDRFNLISISYPLENNDQQLTNRVRGQFDHPNDRDSYTVLLSGNVTLTGSNSQFSNQAFYIRLYDDKKRLVASSDNTLSLTLAAGSYTLVISLCNESGTCYRNTNEYDVQF